jgi:hypothetical protein
MASVKNSPNKTVQIVSTNRVCSGGEVRTVLIHRETRGGEVRTVLINRVRSGGEGRTVSINRVTEAEHLALVAASLKARPGKTFRAEFARGCAAWRKLHHCPLVYGRVS